MPLTLYALYPDQYVPQHAVLATRTHVPDEATKIVRKDGKTTTRIAHLERIASAMPIGTPMTRAEIQQASRTSKAAAVVNLKHLVITGRVLFIEGRIPKYIKIK